MDEPDAAGLAGFDAQFWSSRGGKQGMDGSGKVAGELPGVLAAAIEHVRIRRTQALMEIHVAA